MHRDFDLTWDTFCNLIHQMGDANNYFDVIRVTELFSISKRECILPGHQQMEFATGDETTRSKGGVAIMLKITFSTNIDLIYPFLYPTYLKQYLFEIKLGRKNFIIGTVYRPNSYPKADLDILYVKYVRIAKFTFI